MQDDTEAIQNLLVSGMSVVELPAPMKHYCISRTLKIHSIPYSVAYALGEGH